MALDLGELVGSLRLDTNPFNAAVTAAEVRAAAAAKKLKDDLDVDADVDVDVDVDTSQLDKAKLSVKTFRDDTKSSMTTVGASITGILTAGGAIGPMFLAAGAALSAAAAGGTAVLAATGPAAAAGLAVYAGGFLAVQSAALLTQFALDGVADAAGGDQEAFDKLSPAGQELATTLKELNPELEGLRSRLQEGMFEGFNSALDRTASSYLPMANAAAKDYGTTLGGLADDASKAAESPFFKSAIRDILEGNRTTMEGLGSAGISLSSAAVQLFASAQPLINMFAEWASGAAATIDKTVTAANESGKLADFWDKAANRGSTLWGILSNLGSALGNVFSIGAAEGKGGQMLKTLERGSQLFEDWTESAGGVEKISQWFDEGRTNLSAMWRLVTAVSDGLSDMGSGAKLAPLIDQITNEVIPPLMDFLENANASGALGSLVTAVGSVIEVFASLSENDASLYAFADTLNFLASSAEFVIEHVPGAGTALGGLFTVLGMMGAFKLVGLGPLVTMIMSLGGAALTAGGQMVAGWAMGSAAAEASRGAQIKAVAMMIAGWIKMGAMAVAHGARVAAGWVLSAGAGMASALASFAVAVATTVAGWVVMGAQALAGAARVAAAWLIAMGPIGLAIAAIVGIGIVIYKNWDQIKEWTGAAWDWVVNKVKAVPGLLLSFFLNFTLPGLIIKHWDSIKEGTSAAWGAITGFVRSIPGKLLSFFLNWTIAGQFIKHWDQMRTGAVNKGTAIVSWVSGLPGRLVSALGNLGSKLLGQGQQLIAGLQQGASNRIGAVINWVQGIPGKIQGAIPNPLGMLSGIGGDIIAGLKAGIDAGADRVMSAVNAIIDKIPKFIREKLGISSPSKVMRELAKWIPAGIAAGMTDGTAGVDKALAALTDKIEAQFDKDADETEKRITRKYANIAKNIKKKLDGEAERKALQRNEKAEEDALKKADKAARAKHKAVLELIKAQNPAIRANALAQDDVTKRLEEQSGILTAMKQKALDYATGVRDTIASTGSLGTLTGSGGFAGINTLIKQRTAAADKADAFAAAIDALRGKLNDTDLQDLVAQGPQALSVAQGIVAGGDDAIAELNALQARMQASGQALGDRVSTTLYAAGIAGQQSLVDGLTGDLAALEAAAVQMGNVLVAAITKAMKGIGDAVDKGLDEGTKDKDGKGGKRGKRLASSLEQGAKNHLGIRSPSSVFRAIGGNVVDGMILGLDDKALALKGKVSDVVTNIVGDAAAASLDAGVTVASAPPAPVPESPEVARWRAAQQPPVQQEWNIYETTNAQATAAEVSRRQAFAGAGA